MNYRETDPEFIERFTHFAFTEVVNEEGQQLDEETRYMAILSALLGCQGVDAFEFALSRALDAGLNPVMIKEIVYQSVDYLGIGRVLPFLETTNRILTARGVQLPLEGQATTTMQDRLEKGAQTENFRRRNERRLEKRTHQSMVGSKLLWRLLYPYRAHARTARDDHLLLFSGSGRL